MTISYKARVTSVYGEDVKLKNYVETVHTESITGSYNINLDNGNVQSLTLTGNVTLDFIGEAGAGFKDRLTLLLTQDATGGRVITWPGSVQWIGGSQNFVTTPSTTEVVSLFTTDGGTNWLASQETLTYLTSNDIGTTANKLVQLDGAAKLPAVDGSQLTNLLYDKPFTVKTQANDEDVITTTENILGDVSTGPFMLKLPAAPVDQETIIVLNKAGSYASNNLRLNPNGNTILNQQGDYILDVDNAAVELIYDSANTNWMVYLAGERA